MSTEDKKDEKLASETKQNDETAEGTTNSKAVDYAWTVYHKRAGKAKAMLICIICVFPFAVMSLIFGINRIVKFDSDGYFYVICPIIILFVLAAILLSMAIRTHKLKTLILSGKAESVFGDSFPMLDSDETVPEAAVVTPDIQPVATTLRSYQALHNIDAEYAGMPLPKSEAISFAELTSRLCIYAGCRGIKIPETVVASLLSAMSSSRLVVIEADEEGEGEYSLAVARVVAEFFGSYEYELVCHPSWSRASEFLTTTYYPGADPGNPGGPDAAPTRQDTPFLRFLYRAHYLNTVTAAVVNNLAGAPFGLMFSDWKQYFASPLQSSYVYLPEYDCNFSLVRSRDVLSYQFRLPKNVWYLVVMQSGTAAAQRANHMLDYAESVHFTVPNEAPEAQEFAGYVTGFTPEQLSYMTEKVREEQQPDESLWQKVDALDTFLKEKTGAGIGNPAYIHMEEHIPVFAACCADNGAALDAELANAVSGYADGCLADEAYEQFVRLMDKNFTGIRMSEMRRGAEHLHRITE